MIGWQDFASGLVVLAALVWCGWKLVATLRASRRGFVCGGGCVKCPNMDPEGKPEPKLVQLGPPRQA
jgi:hypothetical protein